jgi:ATP-dependent Lon protease
MGTSIALQLGSDEEFEEYVAYAVECRRRVKEQMNKRKPDDEFARIDLSYIGTDGKEVVVYCPESRNAFATLAPVRGRLRAQCGQETAPRDTAGAVSARAVAATPTIAEAAAVAPSAEPLTERHYTIQYGDVGHTYDGIFGPYLSGAKTVAIEDPFIRQPHQIANFVRFCETVLKFAPTVRRLDLIAGYDEKTDLATVREKLEELKQSLLEADVALDIELKDKIHDREVRMDNGWIIKIGRGLDFYQRPESWFAVGANDLSLRKCLETKVDIFKAT